MQLRVVISILILTFLAAPAESSQDGLVSGRLAGINAEVQIAFNSESGNALIVWTNSIYKENESSRIYAAEMFSHPDGTLEFSDPFMISEDEGNNSRPGVKFLPEFSRYIVFWDTSNPDISDYRVNEDQLPDNTSHVYARTYAPRGFSSPAAVSYGKLGGTINISNHNNIRNAFNASLSTVSGEKGLELLFFYSAKRWKTTDKNFHLLASVWQVEVNGLEPANNFDISIKNIDVAKIITDESVVAAGGIYKDEKYYLSAKELNNRGESIPKIYKVDYQTLKLEGEIVLAEDHIEGPLNVSGHLMDLGVTSEKDDTGEFRLLSNFSDSDDIISVKNDLEEKTVKVTDSPLRPEDQIVLMDFFRVAGDDDERAGSYILCAIDETILRYRKISSENGKPQGGSKLGLVINDLVIGSIDSEYCCDKVNLVYSSIISKKKSRIYFERFEME